MFYGRIDIMISDFVEQLALGTYGRSTRDSIFLERCVKCVESASYF